jgi:hypothetical protein
MGEFFVRYNGDTVRVIDTKKIVKTAHGSYLCVVFQKVGYRGLYKIVDTTAIAPGIGKVKGVWWDSKDKINYNRLYSYELTEWFQK